MASPIHQFLRWAPAAVAAALAAIVYGTPQAYPETRPWFVDRWHDVTAWMIEPWHFGMSFVVAAAVVLVWLWVLFHTAEEPGHDYAELADLLRQFPSQPNVNAIRDSPPIMAVPIEGKADINLAPVEIKANANILEGRDVLDAVGITGLSGLYVGNIIVAAGALEIGCRLEFAIVGYNGSSHVIRVSEVSGRIRAGTGNLRDYVNLPTPLFQGVLNAQPGTEFVLQMRQDVTSEQAREYLEALDKKNGIGLDLREFNITVSSVENPEKTARLPLWDGVNLRRRDDIVSNRNTILRVEGAAMSITAGEVRIATSQQEKRNQNI